MKYKSLLVVLLLVSMFLVMHGGAIFGEDIKPPSEEFLEAKRIAMSAVPDSDGDYVVGAMRSENGRSVIYFVFYGLKHRSKVDKIIAGGQVIGETIFSVSYGEYDGEYVVEVGNTKTGQCYRAKTISEKEASFLMRNVLKHISSNGIDS